MSLAKYSEHSACLYVGNLDPTVTETELRKKLSQVGAIDRLCILRQSGAKLSLGCGYVYYERMADAEKAFVVLNSDVLNGRPLCLAWVDRNIFNRANSSCGKIHVRNLFHTIDNNALHDLFSSFGQISFCKVVRDEVMRSKGFGFVYFETIQAAEDAVRKMNGKLVCGRKISADKFVQEDLSKIYNQGDEDDEGYYYSRDDDDDDDDYDDDDYDDDDDEEEEEDGNFTNVFIKNFAKELNNDSLKELFSVFGEITNHAVETNEKGESKGYGYVSFKSSKSAKMAVEIMNGKQINSYKLFVGPWQSKERRERSLKAKMDQSKGCNLFVKNLAENIDDNRLNRLFSKFGHITSAKVMRKENGESKCHGFVCFGALESAEKAKKEMDGRKMDGKRLYVATAQKKDDRKALMRLQKSVEQQMKQISFKSHSRR